MKYLFMLFLLASCAQGDKQTQVIEAKQCVADCARLRYPSAMYAEDTRSCYCETFNAFGMPRWHFLWSHYDQ
jgi:hypothetical protein